MREIGSEFWKPLKQHVRDNESFYLSGRTALDVIIRDAIKSYGITSVLMPSYCCHTMIEPILINGIKLRFYDVYVKDGILKADVPEPIKHEMLYIMKYFGDTDIKYEGSGKSLSGWATTVEDLTHSCFTVNYSTRADYWFTSYRKWFAVAGIAVAGKRYGMLEETTRGQNKNYIEMRNRAYDMKQHFVDGDPMEKQAFLSIFRKAEEVLGKDYRDYGVDYEDIHSLFQFLDQIDEVRSHKRENAKILMDGLKGLKGVSVFTDFQDANKCPLFVPVIIEDDRREALRKHLINKDIYCPVHWPISEYHVGISDKAKEIYRKEMSLVCDQRYGVNEMERIVGEIKEFYRSANK